MKDHALARLLDFEPSEPPGLPDETAIDRMLDSAAGARRVLGWYREGLASGADCEEVEADAQIALESLKRRIDAECPAAANVRSRSSTWFLVAAAALGVAAIGLWSPSAPVGSDSLEGQLFASGFEADDSFLVTAGVNRRSPPVADVTSSTKGRLFASGFEAGDSMSAWTPDV